MSNEQEDVAVRANEASVTMATARVQYSAAVDAMAELELERSKLVGPGWNTSRMMSLAQKALPLVMKYGSVLAGGGGLAAMFADPGAFAGLLSGITSVFSGG